MEDELLDDFSFEEATPLGDYEEEDDYQEEEEEEIEDAEEGEQELQEEDDDSSEEENEYSEEQDEESEDEEEVSFTPFIETLLESGTLDWDGETEYEDSVEGFQQMVEDNVNSKVNQYLASLPEDVQRLIEVGLKGGDVREAFQRFEEVDYSQANIEDEDVAKELIREFYTSTNPKWNEARINKQIEMLEDAGELEDEAKLAQEYLVEQTEAERQEYHQSLQAQREADENAYYEELNAYTEIIDKNDSLMGLPFASKAEKEAFKAYVFERGEDGKTQAERDDDDRTTRIAKEFYKFRKFGFEDIERKSTTKKAVELKKSLQRFADKNSKSNRSEVARPKGNAKFSLGSIDWD